MSKISWTNKTWNPVVGCSKVSDGCKNCYAERMAHRLSCMGQFKYDIVTSSRGKWNGSVNCDESALDKPMHWKNPRRIFVCSMGDLFHESVPFEFIDKVVKVLEACPHHTGQILTKRSERLLEYSEYRNYQWPDNIIGMVTAENQPMADLRIPYLLQCGFRTTGVSVEPMLGAVRLDFASPSRYEKRNFLTGDESNVCDLRGTNFGNKLDWVIIGCESGPGKRECKLEWVRNLVGQCKAANEAVFVKQLNIDGKVVKKIEEFPTDLQIQEYPK